MQFLTIERKSVGANGRPFLWDATLPEKSAANGLSPTVLFLHGFKGFKDWGTFPLIARKFAEKGYIFVKMNFSHNGTTPETPIDFTDLEAFGRNTFSYEATDVNRVLDALANDEFLRERIDFERLAIIGHSRGGGIAIIVGADDPRIPKVVSWAGVSNFDKRFSTEQYALLESEGKFYIENARTKQLLPIYRSLMEDYYANEAQLNVLSAASRLKKPYLILHGDADETVSLAEARALAEVQPAAQLTIIPNGNHTFGGAHPFLVADLPPATQILLQNTWDFLEGRLSFFNRLEL